MQNNNKYHTNDVFDSVKEVSSSSLEEVRIKYNYTQHAWKFLTLHPTTPHVL